LVIWRNFSLGFQLVKRIPSFGSVQNARGFSSENASGRLQKNLKLSCANWIGLCRGRGFSESASASKKEPVNDFIKYLQAKIKIQGGLSLADYMKEVLTNPLCGYYMHKDVFGVQGDFTTSPEISQVFGEVTMINKQQWLI